MHKTVFRGAIALSIVVATVVAIAAGGGRSTATAADPPTASPRPEVLSPSGFGRIDIDVRHVPNVNPGRGEGRKEPKNPDGVLPGGPSVSDPGAPSVPNDSISAVAAVAVQRRVFPST